MNKSFNLSIDKPCSEKFDEFQKTNNGGFCNSCQKEVIDFTKMTDSEILAFFKNGQKNTCGRFRESQLKIYSEVIPSKKKGSFNLLGAGLISFSLALLSANNSDAQHLEHPKTIQKSQKEDNKTQSSNTQVIRNEHIVEGVVISSEDKSPLPGVNVVLKGTMIGTITDSDGKFRISLPNFKNGDKLVFHYVGFVSQEIIVSKNVSGFMNITLEMDADIMGEVSTNEVYTSKRSFWQKVKGILR